jgi:hypothetical protein
MKRPKYEIGDGSILLLDTMCNAFGGVIFISFLLVVLINSTSISGSDHATSSASRFQLIEKENQREELTVKLARLKRAMAAQAVTSGVVVSKDVLENAARLKAEEARHRDRVQSKSDVIGSTNRAQIEFNKIKSDTEASQRRLDDLRKRLAMVTSKISQSAENRSRSATAPKMTRAGSLRAMEYFLQNGALYGPLVQTTGDRNTDDFTFTPIRDVIVIDPAPGSGLRIGSDGKDLARIERKLASARPGYNSVHLHIFEDSYRQFESMRLALEDSGLSYAVIPWEPGDRLILSDQIQERWEQN